MLFAVIFSSFILSALACPLNYTSYSDFDDICMKIYTVKVHRSIASQQCESDGAELVTISDAFFNSLVAGQEQNAKTQVWIGLRCSSDNLASCQWDDGSPLQFNRFLAGNPNSEVGGCVYMASSGLWLSADCERTQMGFACSTKIPHTTTTTEVPTTPIATTDHQTTPSASTTNEVDSTTSSLYHCSNQLWTTAEHNQIQTPNYPDEYPPNLTCNYLLQASVGKCVQIVFTSFRTETCCDKVFIFDGPYVNYMQLLYTLSGKYGQMLVLNFTSTGRTMLVQLSTDYEWEYQGFQAIYYDVVCK